MNLFKRVGLLVLFGIVLLYVSFSLFKGTKAISDIPANPAFDDINFYKCVINSYNKENKTNVGYDANLSDDELKKIEDLTCNYENIISAKGLEKLTNLTSLYVYGNKLTELDVSNNTALTYLYVYSNKLTELDVSKNTALTGLYVNNNQLTELDVSKNTALTGLHVYGNKLTELDVSKNTALTSLYVSDNQLTELDVSKNTALTSLNVDRNKLTELDVSKNTALKWLYVYSNNLTELDVSKNTALKWLEVYRNKLTELDVSKNTALTSLSVDFNLYVYKGNEFNVGNKIKLPEHLNYEEKIKNSNIVILDESGNGIATGSGVVVIDGSIVGTNSAITTTINIVEITSSKYLIDNINDEIGIGFDSISYDEFISNINIPKNISIKVFDNDREVKDGNITLGMKVMVYYKDELLNMFDITDKYEYLIFDDSLTIYKNDVANVLIDTNVKKLLELINTSGKVSIYDKNGNLMTNEMMISGGSKIKIEMSNIVIGYDVFFKGDVDGDGKLGLSDIMKLSKYVYVDKNSLSGIHLVVADYNRDKKYNLQDIMKIANKIYKGGE